MQTSKKNRDQELFNILSGIKMASLLFCTVLFLNHLDAARQITNMSNGKFQNESLSIFLGLILFFVYIIWYVFSVKAYESKHFKKIQLVENIIYIFLFTSLILISETYDSEYKLLYIFIIIISSLQLGMKLGLITAISCSLIILSIDLFFAPVSSYNSLFDKDLILISVFIFTAIVLGHYVQLEKEKMFQKNLDLENLTSKVREKELHSRRIHEMLFNNELCYNLLFQNSKDSIIVHRLDKIIFSNQSAANLLNYKSSDELLTRSFKDILTSDNISYIYTNLFNSATSNSPTISFESTALKPGGEVISVYNTSTKFIYEGRLTILTILHDITSDKKVEKLQRDVKKNLQLLNETRELNRLTTEFLSNISHELKTPLNVIFSAIQVLSLKENECTMDSSINHSKYLKIVKQNCFRLTRLINNLLDLSRFDSGFLKLNLENQNVITLVEDISQSVVPYLDSKNIKLIFDTEIEEEIIALDPDKIERIILNILSNSFKFTHPGGKILINMYKHKDIVNISIRDTGIGIPKNKLNMIFERFRQVDNSLKRPQEGSGIGLSLVKSFVEMHSGTISVTSELGKGSEFIITLPIYKLSPDYKPNFTKHENNIEHINIEFSDIYSNSI